MTLTAWGDESIRMSAPRPTYLVAAAVVPDDCNLSKLQAAKPKGASKLHWREMTDSVKRESLNVIAEMNAKTIIAEAFPLVGAKQERARRKCLEAILPKLEALQVDTLTLESRTLKQDKKDREMVAALRSRQYVSRIRVQHLYGANEPHLWLPDQLLGAYGDTLSRGQSCEKWDDLWQDIRKHVEVMEVEL